ncbi:zinc finger protein basonuclin-2 [Acanthopagrus schlegelii]
MRTTPDTEESIRCTAPGCSCQCFKPGSVQLRSCDRCGHGWVSHALEKLHRQAQQPSTCGPVEVALPGLVFDLSSLVLYGAQAIPVRLKILLDRLYSILTPDQVGHILHTLGWSLGDYVRGYMLQFPGGKVLDRWLMVTPEEELLILKQFLRFGETRPIVELMTLQCLTAANHLSDLELNPASKSCQSNLSTFIERNGGTPGPLRNIRGDSLLVAGVCRFKRTSPDERNDSVHHFETFPGGQSLLLPFHFPSSTFHCLVPPHKELVPPSKLTQCLRRPNGIKLAERQRQEGGSRGQENDPLLQQPKVEPVLRIKADPDKPNPVLSIRHQDAQFNFDQRIDLQRANQQNPSSHSPSSDCSLHPSVSSSPPKISHKSFSLNPLPSFSSSFLCPLPASSFSSSLHPLPSSPPSLRPLPSSLCSLSSFSPAGCRKGRVCCGVCGKSFYDKGTLKIHYNAVHLKIKHRCTVVGCTMVFSSLRSRNRHSANPNPRLHTGAGRDNAHSHRNTHADLHAIIHSETQMHKDSHRSVHNAHTRMCKEIGNTLWQQDDDANTRVRIHDLRNGLNGHTEPQHGCRDKTPPNTDSASNLHPQTPPPPPPLLPACTAPPLVVPTLEKTDCCRHLLNLHTTHTAPAPNATANGQPVSRDHDVTACTSPPTNQQRRRWDSSDPVPKKKPRKSSMPVKIEREKAKEEEC